MAKFDKQRLIAHQRGLDGVAAILHPIEKKDPNQKIDPSLRKQLQTRFRDLSRMGFGAAKCQVARTVAMVQAQITDLRWDIESRVNVPTEPSTERAKGSGSIADLDRANRAKRRREFIYPLWAKANPPINSAEQWAIRSSVGRLREINRNTCRDFLNGKTKQLHESIRIALAKPLQISPAELLI